MNKKNIKYLCFSIIVVIILYFVFSNRTIYKFYNYTGESRYWSAKYNITSVEEFTLFNILNPTILNYSKNNRYKYISKAKKTLTITYKGDIKNLYQKKLFIEYISSSSKGSKTLTFDTPPKNKVFKIQSSGEGNSIEDRNETIKLNIKLDNKIETLTLQPVY